MKITSILESPKDERILQATAKALLQIVRAEIKAEENRIDDLDDDDEYEESGEMHIGTVGELIKKHDVNKKVLGHLSNRLRKTKVVIVTSPKLTGESHGTYTPGHNELAIYYPLYNSSLKPMNRIVPDKVESILVHELRHRLDDSYSRGGAFVDAREPTEEDKKHRLGAHLPYFQEKTEINARLSEVQRMFSKWLAVQMKNGEVPDPVDVIEEINSLMKAKNLVDIFPSRDEAILAKREVAKEMNDQVAATDNKQYRRLVSRIMKYYSSEVERIQDERH